MDELPAGDDDDAGQSEQAPADVAPSCDENVPGAHSLQASAPAIDLNFPATQAVHVPPFGPEVPGSHKH